MNRSKKAFLGRVSVLKGLFVASLVAAACSSKSGGSESNFVACSDDGDCHGGLCVSGHCEAAGGGAGGGSIYVDSGVGGAEVADSSPAMGGGPSTGGRSGGVGGVPPLGGTCATGGFFNYVAGAAGSGTGGGIPQGTGGVNSSCSVDDQGFAVIDHDTFCHDNACPDAVASLLKGLSCTREGTGAITLTVGCGQQTFSVSDSDTTFTAVFDPGAAKMVGATLTTPYPSGTCNSSRNRTGALPADCPAAKTYVCERMPAITECRSPDEPGCGTCCSGTYEYQGQVSCNVQTRQQSSGQTYDLYGSVPGDCPCNCKPCSTCSPALEAQLRMFPERPDCACPATPPPEPPPGGGGSSSGGAGPIDACENICGWKAQLQRACPGITP